MNVHLDASGGHMFDLTFLGSFADEPPLVAWPGHCDIAQERFQEKTGFRLEPFTLANGDDHDQYYFSHGVSRIRSWFMALPPSDQREFLEGLYRGYYADSLALEELTDRF